MCSRSRESSGVVSVESDKEFKSGVENPFQGTNGGSDWRSAFANVYLSIAAARVKVIQTSFGGPNTWWKEVGIHDAHTFVECHDSDFGFEEVDVEFEEHIAWDFLFWRKT